MVLFPSRLYDELEIFREVPVILIPAGKAVPSESEAVNMMLPH